MTDKLVNVLDRSVLGERTIEVPWIEGAEITFLDDVPGNFSEQLEKKRKELGDVDVGYWSTVQTIVRWNFSGENGKLLKISIDNLKKLPMKLQKWIIQRSTEVLLTDEERKKG